MGWRETANGGDGRAAAAPLAATSRWLLGAGLAGVAIGLLAWLGTALTPGAAALLALLPVGAALLVLGLAARLLARRLPPER